MYNQIAVSHVVGISQKGTSSLYSYTFSEAKQYFIHVYWLCYCISPLTIYLFRKCHQCVALYMIATYYAFKHITTLSQAYHTRKQQQKKKKKKKKKIEILPINGQTVLVPVYIFPRRHAIFKSFYLHTIWNCVIDSPIS